MNGNPNIASPCPRCAELRDVLKLVVETANASPTIRAGVLRIAADALNTQPATPAASEGSAL